MPPAPGSSGPDDLVPLLVTQREAADILRGIRRGLRPVRGDGKRVFVTRDDDAALNIAGSPQAGGGAGGDDPWFLIVGTGSALATGHTARWRYAWSRLLSLDNLEPSSGAAASYTVDATYYGTTIAAPSGADKGCAYAITELRNVANPGSTTAWYPGGIQANPTATGTSYPSSMAPRPIGGGGTTGTHKQNFIAIARMFPVAGVQRCLFIPWTLSHDGTC